MNLFQDLAKRAEKRVLHGKCEMCNSMQGKLYAATNQDTWEIYKQAYKNNETQILCLECKKLFHPSLSLSLKYYDKKMLSQIPIEDISGHLLPYVRKKHLELCPYAYPAMYLADRATIGYIIELIFLYDCTVTKFIPLEKQEYYMDVFLEKYGYIYIIFPRIQLICNPDKLIQIVSYFDKLDNKKIKIIYNLNEFGDIQPISPFSRFFKPSPFRSAR